ncbi:hypothetical protein [Hymenobacter yonginensis]|uniref:DNA-directed DNA polymerase family A palm domain-containing protein n=1 Tax=Hymenobacter yonginensis TaxID=748197 RepID=A0ABY7PU04_9BACT|nr:hypothetical protein [Hymenobacter yonginensis]WBO86401.1 hypothetical protein O9Z63_09090 [Hymenobacter yonginensis]
MPPNLSIDHLNYSLVGCNKPIAKVTHYVAILYTVLCQDLIRLKLANNPDGYTQIHSLKLESIFGNRYKLVIDLLINAELLEVNQVSPEGVFKEYGFYSKTAKTAKSYRIPKRLLSNDKLFVKKHIESVDKKTSKVVYTKIGALNRINYKNSVIDEYRQLVIDNMDKLMLVDDAVTREIIKNDCERRGDIYSEALASAIIDRFNYSPVLEPTVCLFAGRLHGLITTIIKNLRKRVRFDGEPEEELAELDIVSSQPWFLSIVNAYLIKRFVPECHEAISFFQQVEYEDDVIKFRQLCADEKHNTADRYGIYEYLADAYNKRYNASFTRDQAKRICYRAFFSDYEKKEKLSLAKCERSVVRHQKELTRIKNKCETLLVNGQQCESNNAVEAVAVAEQKLKRVETRLFTQQCFEMFKTEFPNLYKLFRNIKQLKWDFPRGADKSKKIKYYANNALLAQRLEANVVYGVVIKALKANGITQVVTIHDSFMVLRREEQEAKKIILKAFADLGLKPIFK